MGCPVGTIKPGKALRKARPIRASSWLSCPRRLTGNGGEIGGAKRGQLGAVFIFAPLTFKIKSPELDLDPGQSLGRRFHKPFKGFGLAGFGLLFTFEGLEPPMPFQELLIPQTVAPGGYDRARDRFVPAAYDGGSTS